MKAKVFATGNIGKDAEQHKLENGSMVYTFQIATKDYYYDSNGERVEQTQWHEVKRFLKNHNDKIFGLFKKGTNITVSGELMYNHWEKEVEGVTVKMTSAYIQMSDFNINKMPSKD